MKRLSRSRTRAVMACVATALLASTLVAQRRSPQQVTLERSLGDLVRRRDVVEQQIRELVRRRIAHDLRLPISTDELVMGMPAGDPMQRAAIEKQLQEELEAVRDAGARLDALRARLAKRGGSATADRMASASSRAATSTSLPAAPGGPGGPARKSAVTKTPGPARTAAISRDESRFFLVPWAKTESADEDFSPDLPFAFDEVARSLPTESRFSRTLPSRDLHRRAWALSRAGLHRRALAVIREAYPAAEKRPFSLRFLEGQALEGINDSDAAATIYAAIASADLVEVAKGDGEASEKKPGPWARASELAMRVLEFMKAQKERKLPAIEGIKW